MVNDEAMESFYVLGETLEPMLTNDMGSSVEVFDTRGPAGGGPPAHRHAWEEIYVVTKGLLDVTVDGRTTRLGPGGCGRAIRQRSASRCGALAGGGGDIWDSRDRRSC